MQAYAASAGKKNMAALILLISHRFLKLPDRHVSLYALGLTS